MSDTLDRLRSSLTDRYRIDRQLGRGGMATVYLAHDLRHDRPVALKVLHPEVAQILGADRFLHEIRVCARMQHPNILAVHDSGDADGLLWFTMPYVEGESLRDALTRQKQLPLEEAIRLATEVADALHYAHQHGIIHRDVKPENILLSGGAVPGGQPGRRHALLADFGVAMALQPGVAERLTESGFTVGTPLYMSPEQAAAERDLDARSDIYALGCVLFEMLAGEPPYSGPTAQAILAKRLSEPLPHLSTTRQVPPALEQAVARALARAPADRYPTAADLAAALEPDRWKGRGSGTIRSPIRRVRLWWVLAALVVLALALALAGRRFLPAPHQVQAASAAVLPFVDLSPGKDHEYFSDGLTEELITTLSRIPGLRVAARTSSFQFKGQNPDPHEVGRRLEVGAVLAGSVRQSGDRLRVSAQLIDTRNGYQLWSESYDRNLTDVFQVQEDVARSIVSALRVRLAPAGDSALAVRPTTDLEAYDLYLKGRFAWNQRTGPSLRQAVDYLEQAVARDSSFGRAWAALAEAELLVVPAGGGGSMAEAWPRARQAARRALALDSTSGEAYTALAYGSMIYDWDWVTAEENFKRAISVDPDYATGHQWYADFLSGRGRLEESLAQMTQAHQLDPLSLQITSEWGWVYYEMGRSQEAEARIRQALELDHNYAQGHYRLGLVLIQQHRYPEAIASLRRSVDLGLLYSLGSSPLAAAYAGAGDRAAAHAVVADLLRRRAGHELIPPLHLAMAYAGVGDVTAGLEWLNRGIDERDVYFPENFSDPLLDPLRHDPRYPAVLARMGLPTPAQ